MPEAGIELLAELLDEDGVINPLTFSRAGDKPWSRQM